MKHYRDMYYAKYYGMERGGGGGEEKWRLGKNKKKNGSKGLKPSCSASLMLVQDVVAFSRDSNANHVIQKSMETAEDIR